MENDAEALQSAELVIGNCSMVISNFSLRAFRSHYRFTNVPASIRSVQNVNSEPALAVGSRTGDFELN